MNDPSNTTSPTGPGELPPLALRPKQAAAVLNIGGTLLWSMTNRGEIPHVRVGKCILYPVAALEAWLAEQAAKAVQR